MSRYVAQTLCSNKGHHMVSLIKKTIHAPGPNASAPPIPISEYVIICDQCGLSMAQIQAFRKIPNLEQRINHEGSKS